MFRKKPFRLGLILFAALVVFTGAYGLAQHQCQPRFRAFEQRLFGHQSRTLRNYSVDVKLDPDRWYLLARYDLEQRQARLFDLFPIALDANAPARSVGTVLLWRRIESCNATTDVFINKLSDPESNELSDIPLVHDTRTDTVNGYRLLRTQTAENQLQVFVPERKIAIGIPGHDYEYIRIVLHEIL